MLLSFSVPEMLPLIRDGIAQARGEEVLGRVKRQTIRRRGSRAERLLEYAKHAHWTHPYDLHLWWKSRTAEREFLGAVRSSRVYPITILHSMVVPPNAPAYPILRMDGPRGWRAGDTMIFWSADHGGESFAAEAFADGFASVEAFRDFFVPNVGDTFGAILFKW